MSFLHAARYVVWALLLFSLACGRSGGGVPSELEASRDRSSQPRRLMKEAGVPAHVEPLESPAVTTPAVDPHSTLNNWLEKFHRQAELQKKGEELQQQGKGRYMALEELKHAELSAAVASLSPSTCQLKQGRHGRRRNLIMAPVGDKFDASVWMDHPDQATFDLIVIHYGSNANFTCELCKKVYAAAGPKWKLAYALYTKPEWRQLTRKYTAIMVADDDLDMGTCTLNRAFEIFHEYGLLMAQPSVCDRPNSHTAYGTLRQKPGLELRYTTFIEIMAPIFDMDMYNGFIAPSLYNVYTGWGLDFVWPFLLKYPKDKIGVIDEVCMFHPHGSLKTGGSLYDVEAPYNQWEEMRRREEEYNYSRRAVEKLGYPFKPVLVTGGVPRRPQLPMQDPRTVDQWMATHLGNWYPLAVLGQAGLVLGGLALVLWRRRKARLPENGHAR